MKHLILLTLVVLFNIGCGSSDGSNPTTETIKKSVLVVADEVNSSYMGVLQEMLNSDETVLSDNVEYVFTLKEAGTSANAVNNINTWLTREDKWDIVILAVGIHDAETSVNTSLNDYLDNLRTLTGRIKSKSNNMFFINVTASNTNYANNHYPNAVIDSYNNQSGVLMLQEFGVQRMEVNFESKKHVNSMIDEINYNESVFESLANKSIHYMIDIHNEIMGR